MRLKLFFTVAAIALGLSVQAKEYKYETVAGDKMQTRIYTLDNGLKVFLSVNTGKPRIQTYIAVRTGSKNDPAETTGLAHYLEHLMFKGTKQFGTSNPEAEAPFLADIEQRYEAYRKLTDPAARKQAYHEIDSVSQLAAKYFIPNEYDKLMAAIGAEGTNAYTSNDVTCYQEDIPSNEIDNWAKIQADRFQNMVIRGFHTELEAVYEEYNMGLTSDVRKMYATLYKKLWPNHPYGLQTTIGTQEHLKNPSITNIKNYFNKWYRPNNVAICMSGEFDPDQTIAIIDKYFSSWQPGADVKQPTFAPLTPLTQPQDTTVVGPESESVWMGWRAKQANTLQSDTLELMANVLSNGRAGLFDLDLNQQMKVQYAGGRTEMLRDYGAFMLQARPKQGQTMEEVRTLMLEEIAKLKQGNFPDNLLPSIINQMKRSYYQRLESNEGRADMFVDAFINEIDWKQKVESIDRISKINKADLVAFANQFFTDGYVTIFKKQGVDSLQKKIEKPAITAIPTNRDMMSDFVKAIQNTEVAPIQPRFVDWKNDMTITKTKSKLPLYYVKNNVNGLFEMAFRYEFGKTADKRYSVASDYIDYLGTDQLTATEIKQKFYELGCDYSVYVSAEDLRVYLYGLSENMQPALEQLENLMQNLKADQAAYDQMVELMLKSRADGKKSQGSCFNHLFAFGVMGSHNSFLDMLSAEQLKQTKPQELVDLLKNLKNLKHSVLYYGPMSEKELGGLIAKTHKTPKKLADVPKNKPYTMQTADQNEVWIAPYTAKNIYLRMFHNAQRDWHPEEAAVKAVFNQYFGGGMNGVVFQEMREARGLAYNAAAYYGEPSRQGDPEYFFTHIITQNDKMNDCIREFNRILNEMPASENAFTIAKEGLKKQLASARTMKMAIIDSYLDAQRLGIDYVLDEKIYNDLDQVTLQKMVDFEKNMIANKGYRYMILGDEKELDMKALEKIGAVKHCTIEEIFGF